MSEEKVAQTQDEPQHEVTRVTLLNAQVCSAGTWDEALEFICRENPAGTRHNWKKDERPELAPVVCADDPKRRHYVFCC